MTRQVVLVLFLATALQCAIAVINSSTSKATDAVSDSASSATTNKISDSVAASSDPSNNRREATDISGPKVIEETYLVLPNNKPNLPVPVYGVPALAAYPGPPPDIPPPPPPSISVQTYGAPPSGSYGPPPFQQAIVPNFKPPQQHYGPPVFLTFPQKNYGPPPKSKPFNVFFKAPTSLYGVPQSYNTGRHHPQKTQVSTYVLPKPTYGVPPKFPKGPKPSFNFPVKPLYGPPKPNDFSSYGPSATYLAISSGISAPNKGSYDGSKDSYAAPVKNLNIPKILPQQPPLPPPGVSAPPTPPDIKYDGWHPIPGLISKPPSAYGAPNAQKHNSLDLNINPDFAPPPLELGNHGSGQAFSDSYTAPLNSVTGSGGIVSSSGLALKPEPDDDITLSLGLSSLGIPNGRESLSVIKSIDYDLSQFRDLLNVNLPLPNAPRGLIPPSGLYGAPPSGQYGTPLLQPSNKPFRETVPLELIQSIGNNIGNNFRHHGPGNQQSSSVYLPPSGPNNPHRPPASVHDLPLENKPLPFHNAAGVTDSYGLPKFTEVKSSYDNIPVEIDLTHNTPGHIPVSYGSPSYNSNENQPSYNYNEDQPSYNSNENQLQTQISLEVPLSGESTYNSHEESPDLEIALSQKAKTVSALPSNEVKEIDEEKHAVSIAKSIHPNSELIKSRDIDFDNIPLKGTQGSYTLSIQSSDGSGSFKSLPHDQILNESILQSILNAIEQPQYNGIGAIRQSFPQTTKNVNFKYSDGGKLSHFKDSESQNSMNSHVVIESPASNNSNNMSEHPAVTLATPYNIYDNNEIAFYFRNNAEKNQDISEDNNSLVKQNKGNELHSVENKNQYESYVSFKTRNSDISYGTISSTNSTVPDKN